MRQIEKTSIFVKDFKVLPSNVQKDLWEKVCILRENVFDKRLNIKKLEGYKGVWRVRVKDFYRLIYTFDKEHLYLLRVRHRKDIYRI